MITLNTNIEELNRVGKTTASRLKRIGIETVHDLLYYFPFRYEDFRHTTPIDQLEPGTSANVVGVIELIQNKRSYKKRMNITEALVSDETEQLKVIWFNQPFIAKNLRSGDKVSLAGKVEPDPVHDLVMKSPVYEKVLATGAVHTKGLVPNYHLTANLTQKQLRFLIKQVLPLTAKLIDWLPAAVIKRQKMLPLKIAVAKIHFPAGQKEIDTARRRLGFNELFLLQLESLMVKRELEACQAEPITFHEKDTQKFVKSLPFKLTAAQKKAAWEIIQDLGKSKPMARLLEGDVGSGKTIVAVLAMLNVALSGKQAVLMVPTEILAHQHFASFSKLLKPLNLPIGIITRTKKEITQNPEKEKVNSAFVIRNSAFVIGTHALIQEKINFEDLALAIIDEQHRFGVEQRKVLTDKSGNPKTTPHFLSMTATPIPRSLALALYGDLDISIINQMPQGRQPILTRVVPENKRSKAYKFIREQIKSGRQVFVICPLIDISDKLGVKSVKEEYKKLNEQVFPDLSIAMLHGKLKSKEKEEIMQDFLNKKTKILVSTSVVEVGVDVPNACVMMIEGADRFGLAQLHQFRGRVGRSKYQSYCFLFTESESPRTMKRLRALTEHHSGFELAKIDLKLRGPGEVYGTAQSGFPELKVATLFDYELMKQAREEAEKIIQEDLKLKKYPNIKKKLNKKKTTHLE